MSRLSPILIYVTGIPVLDDIYNNTGISCLINLGGTIRQYTARESRRSAGWYREELQSIAFVEEGEGVSSYLEFSMRFGNVADILHDLSESLIVFEDP